MFSWADDRVLAPSAASVTDPRDANRLRTFLDVADVFGLPGANERALYLGFGSSECLDRLAGRFSECVGVDPDALAVQRARRSAAVRHVGASFSVGTEVSPDDFERHSFDLIVCDFRRIPAGRDVLRRMGLLLQLLAPGGLAVFDVPRRRGIATGLFGRGRTTGSVGISWPDAAREASLAEARIMWVDKNYRDGTLYCVVRDR